MATPRAHHLDTLATPEERLTSALEWIQFLETYVDGNYGKHSVDKIWDEFLLSRDT